MLQLHYSRTIESDSLFSFSEEEFKTSIENENRILRDLLDEELDIVITVKGRAEQGFLRNHLFNGKKNAKCGICGKEYPVNLFVAAHIKKRAFCSKEERLDYKNIVIPMCKFGCDDLYEKGYITVDNALITQLKKYEMTPDVQLYLDEVSGRECGYWSVNTKKYFDWHKSFHAVK